MTSEMQFDERFIFFYYICIASIMSLLDKHHDSMWRIPVSSYSCFMIVSGERVGSNWRNWRRLQMSLKSWLRRSNSSMCAARWELTTQISELWKRKRTATAPLFPCQEQRERYEKRLFMQPRDQTVAQWDKHWRAQCVCCVQRFQWEQFAMWTLPLVKMVFSQDHKLTSLYCTERVTLWKASAGHSALL